MLSPVKTVSEYLGKAAKYLKEGKGLAKSLAESAPWLKDVAEAAGAATPIVGAALKLAEKWLEQTHPYELGAVACTLAYQDAAREAVEQVWTSAVGYQDAMKIDDRVAERIRSLPPAEEADLSSFSRGAALQHAFVKRAVDKQGQTVDFLLSKNRDKAAAVRFFKKAIGDHNVPEKITLDGSRASHQAVAELKAEGVLPAQTLVRTSKYLNNMIEQDHRRVKQRCYPMLGFKTFGNAEVTLSGIELANKIKKGQFDTSEIAGPGAMILQVWEAVLIA